MALPERRVSNRPPTHVNDLGDQREVEEVSRSGWRWWWVWPLVVALAVWWAGWGWAGTGGWWWGRAAHSAVIPAQPGAKTAKTLANAGAQPTAGNTIGGGPQPMAGDGLQIITAEDKQPLIGQKLAANDLPVRQMVTGHVLWIGEKHPILAVVRGNAPTTGITRGELVDAIGTVKKAPPASRATRVWKLDSTDASRLEKQGVYLDVSELSLPPQ